MDALIDPNVSYQVLLIVQALHLLHHRLVKRHISFVEVIASMVLICHPSLGLVVEVPT